MGPFPRLVTSSESAATSHGRGARHFEYIAREQESRPPGVKVTKKDILMPGVKAEEELGAPGGNEGAHVPATFYSSSRSKKNLKFQLAKKSLSNCPKMGTIYSSLRGFFCSEIVPICGIIV